jgi:hypothetical protein
VAGDIDRPFKGAQNMALSKKEPAQAIDAAAIWIDLQAEKEINEQNIEHIADLEQRIKDMQIAIYEFKKLLEMSRSDLAAESADRSIKTTKKATAQDILRSLYETIFWK